MVVFGEWYVLHCPVQSQLLRTCEEHWTEIFIIVTGAEPSDSWVADGPNMNADMTTEVNRVIADLMELKIHHHLCEVNLLWPWVSATLCYGLELYAVHPLSHVPDSPWS